MNDQTTMNDTTERNTRMTPKQLRSAAHALRTAANALEEVATQLRTLSTEIDTPDDPEPTPAWPTAKHVWWEDEMWTRDEAGDYSSVPDTGGKYLIRCRVTNLHPSAHTFARGAVPVVIVPEAEWRDGKGRSNREVCG